MMHPMIVFALTLASDPVTNGLTTLADDAKGWLALLAVLAGVSAYILHVAGFRHASDVMRTAFTGLAAAAVLCFGAPWFIGLFHA
jgi:predicted membrane protein